jgi:hypothetical protein
MLSARAQWSPAGTRQLSTIATAIEISGKYGNTLVPRRIIRRRLAILKEKLGFYLSFTRRHSRPDDTRNRDLVAEI